MICFFFKLKYLIFFMEKKFLNYSKMLEKILLGKYCKGLVFLCYMEKKIIFCHDLRLLYKLYEARAALKSPHIHVKYKPY